MLDVILRRFTAPDETRELVKGRFDVVHAGGLTIGRATYEPGWKWSLHVGPAVGRALCDVAHVGLVLAGRAAVASADGQVTEIAAGDIFVVRGEHDSWVIGDEPYVSLHFAGADAYAKPA